MATLDIRVEKEQEITEIIFSDRGKSYVTAVSLVREGRDALRVKDEEGNHVILEAKQQVENLIKALNKAISLSWVE